MASQPIDQGAILASGRALVPDYAAEVIRQALASAQQQQAQAETSRASTAAAHEGREAAEATAYQADIQSLPANPTAADFTRLMVRHPKFSEALNRGYQALDENQRRQTFQSIAEVTAAARGGDYALAARLLRERDTADTEAGHPPDPLHAAIQSALESPDEAQRRLGRDLLERATAAVAGADHYASVYGGFQRQLHEVDGILYDGEGQAVAQSPYPRVHLGPDGSSVTYNPVPGIPLIGGTAAPSLVPTPPATAAPQPVARPSERPRTGSNAHPVSNGAEVVRQIYPAAQITDNRRDPNSPLGRANPTSWHNHTGAAVDVRPIPGMTFAQYVAGYRRAGYEIIEARDEQRNPLRHTTGPNWHIVLGQSRQVANTVARVRSRQDYNRLPSGARYVAPDGSVRTKS